jgi:hypothetical protein
MIPVKYNKTGGNAIIRITITASMMHWTYKFIQSESANDSTFKGNSEDGIGEIRMHSLGFPNDLMSEIDTWEFRLANVTTKEQSYSIKIEWEQDGKTLSETWTTSGKLGPGKTIPLGGSAMLI